MIHNQDCITGMQQHVNDDSVDLIFTDPPYGINGDALDQHYNRNDSLIVPGYVDVPNDKYSQFSQDWIQESARVLRPGGSIYIVSGWTNLHHILNALHQTGLQQINHLIAEYTFGVYTTRKWVSSHYHILFWQKPGRRHNQPVFNTHCRFSDTQGSYQDRLSVQKLPRRYQPGQIRNRNQLCDDFVDKFIEYSSNPGDLVLDPFCGGFSTARSAQRLHRKFIGFEINSAACHAFAPGDLIS